MALIGNTLRMQVSFKTFAGETPSSDPLNIKLTIYDNAGEIVDEFSGVELVRVSRGVYYHDYVIPDGKTYLIYEWYGEMETNPAVNRGAIPREYLVSQ
jgi:hypothetical protein